MRVLFLTHRLPYAANRGDRIRALYTLRLLARHADVDLMSLVHDREEAAHAADLRGITASVAVFPVPRLRAYVRALAALAGRRPLTHALLDAPGIRGACARLVERHPPDVVLAYCSGMARFALEPPLDRFPLVLDMVDVDSEKWRVLGDTAAAPAKWVYATEARRLSAFEARAAGIARTATVVNEREKAALTRLAPTADIQVVRNGVDLAHLRPVDPPSAEPRVAFCGVMNYPPNEEAALWFVHNVWPIVRRHRPDARLSLVGSSPTAAIERLGTADLSIEVSGTVPDVRPYLWRAAVSIAPIAASRGLQNKVLEALAAGLPCVVTPAVRAGLPEEIVPGCVVAADATAFADAIVALLSLDPGQRRGTAERAHLASLGWDEQLAPMVPILQAASRSGSIRFS